MLSEECKTYIAAAEECIGTFESAMEKVDVSAMQGGTERVWAFLGLAFTCGMIRNFRAACTLIKGGYARECSLFQRASWEILVNWMYIERDYEKRALQYVDYSRTREEADPEVALPTDEFLRKYMPGVKKLPYNWAGITLRQRVKAIDERLLRLHDKIYDYLSEHAHAGPFTMITHISTSDMLAKALLDPSWLSAKEELLGQVGFLTRGLDQADKQLGLGCSQALEKLGTCCDQSETDQ